MATYWHVPFLRALRCLCACLLVYEYVDYVVIIVGFLLHRVILARDKLFLVTTVGSRISLCYV